jgi:FMN-dependent NADH-azoreductase
MKIYEHNTETDEVKLREMTAEEVKQFNADQIEAETKATEAAKAEAEKAALLAKLGITAEEAKLLLG